MSEQQFCEGCGARLSPSARFCGGCGDSVPGRSGDGPSAGVSAAVAEAGPTEATPAPSAPAGPAPSGQAPASAPAGRVEEELFQLRPLAVQTFLQLLACILTVGIAWLVLWLQRWATRYRITSQRIEIRTGIFDVRRRTIELFRVEDFEVREPLFLRLRGAATLVVTSQDKGEPELLMSGIPDAQAVHDALRSATLSERDRHRVRLLEGM